MVATIKKIERKVGCMELSVILKRKNGNETRRRKNFYYKYNKYIYVTLQVKNVELL